MSGGLFPKTASSLFVRVVERLVPDYNFRLAPIDLVNIYLTVKCQTHTHAHTLTLTLTHTLIDRLRVRVLSKSFSLPIYLCLVVS